MEKRDCCIARQYAVLTVMAFLVLTLLIPTAAQSAGKKVALVIGNSSYAKVPRLPNPANDAADMGAALGKLGFDVIRLIDATQSQMDDAVESFRIKLVGAEAGLFYYAGHGVQSQGVNYLVPVDAGIAAEYQLRAKTLDASMILEAMNAAGCPLNMVILDACRDNPFASMRSMGRGLTVMGAAPTGAIIVYATDPGKTAQDGSGRNGVFTSALLKHIGEPGVDVKAMFDRVGAEVAKTTGNAQNPWISSKFYGTYFLAGAGATVATAPSGPPATPAPEPASKPIPTKPSLAVEKFFGTLTVEVRTAGTLYLNGAPMGKLSAGSSARLDSVEAGQVSLEMKYEGGQTETKTAKLTKNEIVSVFFTYVEHPKVAEDMVLVDGGAFKMGDVLGDGNSDEKPIHSVTVSSFYLGKCEVTQKEWKDVIGTNPSFLKSDDLPVEQVSWYDAVQYCNKLSMITGLEPCYTIKGTQVSCDFSRSGFRLPTEAEWEFAARGGIHSAGRKYAGGDSVDLVAWHTGNSAGGSHPVGHKQANELGLFDMSGNVSEWCWDSYSAYAASSQVDPQGTSGTGDRVLRGGSWYGSAKGMRATARSKHGPGFRDGGIGLRVLMRVP